MKLSHIKRHKVLAPSGCVICGGKPEYMGVFVPNGGTAVYGYEICGPCREASEKDPAILVPVEEAVLAGEVIGGSHENHA